MGDWRNYSLNQFADVLDSFRIPVNEEERTKNPGETPYYGANGLQGYISGWLFDEPLILIAEDGGYFDEYSTRPVAYKIEGKSWVNNHAHILRPKEEFDFNFVFYSLQHKNITPFIKGGTRAKLNQKELREIEIFSPVEKRHQQKIANILQTIDRAIEHTEALIDKYQQIKAGLMHDLFTRGIGPNGQLRPPRDHAPELYQQTPIGWIPKEWEPINLGKYIESNLYGPRFDARDYDESGNVKTIRGTDFSKDGGIIYSQVPVARLPMQKISRHILKTGDVVVVTTADCGLTAVFEEQEFYFIPSAYAVKYRFSDNVSPHFIKYFMQTSIAKRQVSKYVRQGTLGNLPGSDLLRFHVGLANSHEQKAIVKRLDAVHEKIVAEQKKLDKLDKQKSGLMHDLLTGKVPVTGDAAAPEAAHG
ncbi:MAG: hypothetical protein CO186_06260 [Zetaproteobacteria bacterium CG_4_9_14_3_um_filter_49_83]|nr:MAG: hypothetical protein AUJ56_05340 [Zetaproteobacteria bacterium CG1_02_49_23]PIV31675.1 MAG: hypothetical protein COS35_00180 [Zetaproteobacteria bacterium CG02_land_8_20_14_3_00_50_9]PIY54712.1 MAG: hypothetical protein COZ00_13270 [Zetaproteobacteria bacterium CG_4_10_14_0_8_um_filter_49_80]PJA35362.1 MAG: hypothetical protein CO186_06260 [Zetaproteobacteria bacterium CG_4_9_14_3_um_filter_49_83]